MIAVVLENNGIEASLFCCFQMTSFSFFFEKTGNGASQFHLSHLAAVIDDGAVILTVLRCRC